MLMRAEGTRWTSVGWGVHATAPQWGCVCVPPPGSAVGEVCLGWGWAYGSCPLEQFWVTFCCCPRQLDSASSLCLAGMVEGLRALRSEAGGRLSVWGSCCGWAPPAQPGLPPHRGLDPER